MKTLLALVFNRWVLALLGLCALAVLVWLVGPLVAIADYRPLESERARWLVIGLIVGLVVGRQIWKLFKARRLNAHLMEGLMRQPAPAAAPAAGAEEVALLVQRFEQAVTILKQARVGHAGARSLARFTRQWVYELPWYIFIGAPGCGKSTALMNCGLQFPLAEQPGGLGQGPIGGISGTRNCDWWFTNDAVLLDTAGRYTTQESDQPADSAAWNGFLQLLAKFRARRPINGVLLTLSVSELLEQSAAQRAAHIAALRKRIEELHQQLNIRFPIYILVTKADLLAGFMEFFSEFGKEEREQVWGASLPFDPKAPAQAHFGDELKALEERINARLLERLQQERDPQKRAQLYVFPQQFATLSRHLDAFLGELFSHSAFTEAPLVRGVYFTSATQEGSPIDRVMASLGRALQLERTVVAPQRAAGKSFFLTRLLKDVVFQEAGLAGTNLRRERQRLLFQAGTLAAALVLACAAIGAWSLSYLRNRAYVAEVDARRAVLARQMAVLGPASSDLPALLPLLDTAQRQAAVPGGDGAPLSMSFGLYQGGKLDAAAQGVYVRLLRNAFLPRIVLRIQQQLRRDAHSNPERLYEGLKAYLMLHDARHFSPVALKAFITADWACCLPPELGNEQRRALEQHLDVLLERGDAATAALKADQQLIADTRTAIASTPLAERIYNRLKRQGVASSLPEFTIAQAAGPSAALVFVRASGQSLTTGVPGLYSFDGYYNAFASESERVSAQLADEEDWVLGKQGGSPLTKPEERARLLAEVRQRYLQDYARIWESFIGDIKLVRATSLQQSIELARILSAPSSPLPLLLRAIVKEVTLVRVDPAAKSALETAGEKFSSTRENLLKLFGQQQPATALDTRGRPEEVVDRRFEDLRRMVRSEPPGTPAPIDATIGLINELYTQLTATEAALKGGTTPPPSEVSNKIKAEGSRMPEPVRSLLLNLSGGGASAAMGVTRANLSEALKAHVFEFCNKAISGRYPFSKNSPRDVTQEDFSRLFAAGGVLDEFFQKNLAPFVNTSTSPWNFRDMGEASLGASAATLLPFQRAQAIREVFFRSGGQGAAMRLEFKPLTMDASISQFLLDIDGQVLKYSHGPQVPAQIQWPGPRGSTQVRLQLSPPGANASGQVFEGPWALFRMFDQVHIDTGAQPEKFIATFSVEGRAAQFEVMTSSVQNPFRLHELEQFQCPGQL